MMIKKRKMEKLFRVLEEKKRQLVIQISLANG